MIKRLISFLLVLCLLIAIPLSAIYKYNPFTRKLDYYEPASAADLGDIGDVTLTGLANGDILYYNGTAWVNLTIGGAATVLTVAGGIPSWQAAGAPAAHAASHEVAGADLVNHDQLTGYLAAQHLTLPAGIAAVLTDHNLLAHTALGLFDASADVDHNATTNYDANRHIDHTAVSILSGGLITGGGTIDGNQTLTLTEATIEAAIDTLPNLTSIGTIATGVWQGTAVGAQWGGTGINSSALSGTPQVTAGVWSIGDSITAVAGDLLVNNDAAQDVKLFAGAGVGENKYQYWYGWDTGTVVAQYVRLQITATGDAVFTTDSGGVTFTPSTNYFTITNIFGYDFTTDHNFWIGYLAGEDLAVGGQYNTLIGEQAGLNVTTGDDNTFVGYQAGFLFTDRTANTFIGARAGYGASGPTEAQQNVAVGMEALYSLGYNGGGNVAVGYKAARALDDGVNNVAIGAHAGYGMTGNGAKNIFVGANSGYTAGDKAENVVVGYYGMYDATTASYNVVVGTWAGQNLTTGQYNTLVGFRAGERGTTVGGLDLGNVAVGAYAMYWNQVGIYNVVIGKEAGEGVSGNSHSGNVIIGYQAAEDIMTGDYNVVIGYMAGGTWLDTESNLLVIDNSNTATPLIYGDFSLDNITINGDFNVTMDAVLDQIVIAQSSATGTEDQPLVKITDARTGATADELSEATMWFDVEGVYAIAIIDGYLGIGDNVYFSGALFNLNAGEMAFNDDIELMLGTSKDIEIQYRSNSTEDAYLLLALTKMSADDSSAIFLTRDLKPWGYALFNDWTSPTFIVTNDEGADENDFAGVIIGERTQSNVAVAHYYDFYAMTGAIDGSVDPTTTELAAIFRFGASGSATPGYATTPGDVLFEGSVEVDGALWVADNPIRENLLTNSGFGVWSQSDANKGLATITYDAGAAGGGSAPSVGDAVVGGTSGAVAKVISYTIATGAFATNDATGVVTVGAVSSDFAFVDNETITFAATETSVINMTDGAVQVGLLQNGGFATDTDPPPGWTAAISATLTTEGAGQVGNCMMVANGAVDFGEGRQSIVTVVGKIYKFSVYFKKGTADSGNIRLGATAGEPEIWGKTGLTDAGWTLYTFTFEATTTTTHITLRNESNTNGHTNYWDEVTLYEITPCATAGDTVAMDGWIKDSTADIYREHSGANVQDGSFYANKLVVTAAADYVRWPGGVFDNEEWYMQFQGRAVTIGKWVKTSTASHAKLTITDSAGSTSSSFHTGGGAYEWLEVARTINAAATSVAFYVYGDAAPNVDGSTIIYHCQGMLVFGSSIGEGNYKPKSQEFIWLEKAIPSNVYDGLLNQSDLAFTDLNLEADSDAMLPKGAKIIAAHTEIDDSGSGAGLDVHLQLRKDATAGSFYCNSVAGKPNNVHSHQMGLQPCDVNGDIDIHLDASGASTFDINSFQYHGVQIN